MKIPKLLLPIFLLLFCITATAQIKWLKDYKAAAAEAKESGKPLMLDFTASWCKPCQVMESTFWVRGDVVEVSANFVCVKVDFDTNLSLRSKYGISGIPNVIFTDPWGMALFASKGFGAGKDDEIFRKISYLPFDFSEIKEAGNLIEDDKNNKDALNKIADFYDNKKFYRHSNDYYKRVLKLETTDEKRELLMAKMGFNFLRSNAPDEALEVFEKFRKELPQSTKTDAVIYGQIVAYQKKDKLKDAQKMFAQLKTSFPFSTFIADAEKILNQPK